MYITGSLYHSILFFEMVDKYGRSLETIRIIGWKLGNVLLLAAKEKALLQTACMCPILSHYEIYMNCMSEI